MEIHISLLLLVIGVKVVLQNSVQTENKWINYSNVDYPILGSFDNGDVQILDIVEDYDKNLWMGNYTGAVKFNPQVGVSSLENYGPSNSSLQGFTYDVDLAPDSTIWFTKWWSRSF